MFIVLNEYLADLSVIESLLPEHLEWVKAQYAAGVFVASGKKVPWDGSVILARGIARSELEKVLGSDPFAKAGAARAIVTEVQFARTADGFEILTEGS